MNYHEILNELIAKRAQELSQDHDSEKNNPTENWLQAEQEILHELSLRSDELYKGNDIRSDNRACPLWF